MKILEEYLLYLNDQLDPVTISLIATGVGAASLAHNVIDKRKNRKECIKIAKSLKDPEKRKEAMSKCLGG